MMQVREDELLKGVDKLAHDEGMLLDGPVWLYALGMTVAATRTNVHKRHLRQKRRLHLLHNNYFWFGIISAACASAGLALMVGGGYPISLQGSRRRQIT